MRIFPFRTHSDGVQKNASYWLLRVNHRNRSIFYALLFATLGSHFAETGASATEWMLLVLQFLVYPHLAYLWARWSGQQRRAEHCNQMADGAWAGLWIAGLGCPLWIAFTMFAGACLHMVVFYGFRGLPIVLAAMGLGAGVSVAFGGWPGPHLQTDLRTTLVAMATLTIFFVTYALDGYRRAMHQYRNEQKLRGQYEEISALKNRLQEQAVRDPLTGLLNRRHLETALPSLMAQCRGNEAGLAVVLVDIDHFKKVNDRYGHAGGDTVLKKLAQLMPSAIRPDDLTYRFGGEEFLMVLSGVTAQCAFDRAEALRIAFSRNPIRADGHDIFATLSCGVAMFPGDGETPGQLLQSADRALYDAKAAGRNQVKAGAPAAPGAMAAGPP